MIDVYGSLGSAQSSNCAGSAVFPSNYMTGAPAPAYLDKGKEPLSVGAKVALAVGVVAAGAVLYWMAKSVPSTLAANDAYSPFPIERLPGGRAAGMRPSDFDPNELRRGTEHELEHTDDWRLAREIAMDHLAEDEGYYEKLEAMERGTFRDNPDRIDRVVERAGWSYSLADYTLRSDGAARWHEGLLYVLSDGGDPVTDPRQPVDVGVYVENKDEGEWEEVGFQDFPNLRAALERWNTIPVEVTRAREFGWSSGGWFSRDNPYDKAACEGDCLAGCRGMVLGKGLADLPEGS